MKVLHVIRSLDPRCGGPPGALRNIVPGQIRQGHEVSILTTTSRHAESENVSLSEYVDAIQTEPVFDGANLVFAPVYKGYGPAKAFAYAPEGVRWFRKQVRDPKGAPDVVHLHEVFGYLQGLIPGLARRNSIPYVFRPAGGLDETCFNQGRRLLKRAFAHCWLKKGIRHASFVHVTSHFEADQIKHLSDWIEDSRVRLIPFGLQPSPSSSAEACAAFAAKFPQVAGRRMILHIARIHSIKRLDWIVEAMSLLPPDFSDVVLFVAGSDSGYRSTVELAIRKHGMQDRVIFGGFLSGELKQGALDASRVFVMPSIHENYGFSVVEALAHGTPSIVTRGVASSVYVRDSNAGLVVDDSPKAIADALVTLFSANREEIGRKARKFVEENLSRESCLVAIDRMYRDAVGNGVSKS